MHASFSAVIQEEKFQDKTAGNKACGPSVEFSTADPSRARHPRAKTIHLRGAWTFSLPLQKWKLMVGCGLKANTYCVVLFLLRWKMVVDSQKVISELIYELRDSTTVKHYSLKWKKYILDFGVDCPFNRYYYLNIYYVVFWVIGSINIQLCEFILSLFLFLLLPASQNSIFTL